MQRRTIQEVSVEGAQRRKPKKRIVYSIKVAWSDGTINIIYRRYSEVLQLERNLVETFPSNKRQRVIPSLQGRIKLVPTSVHTKVDRIRDFLLNLISLPGHTSKCQLVISFFTPRPEDLESIEPKTPHSRKKSKRNTAGNILRKISSGNSKTASCIGEPVLLEQYVVLKNYDKQYHNDISLTKGYTVGVIEKHESGWWQVDCEGDLGWVPASFIKPVHGDNDDDGDSITTERFPAGREEIYMTTNSYQAKKDDEISFEIGVNLHVIEKTLDGWWRVVYMNEEGWAPAVFLKRVGVATGNSPAILKRLPMMDMQLRDKAGDTEESLKTTVQDEECSLLTPVWNTHRRHSASEVEVSHLKTERQESQLTSRRSTWGSTGVLRDALTYRGLSISEFDLRLANRKEEESKTPETLRQNCSFSFPDHMKDICRKSNVSERLSSEGGQTSVNMPSSPPLRLRSFSDSPDLSNLIASRFKPSVSKRLLNQREFRCSLPSICITPSASDAEHSPSFSGKLGSSLGNVENGGGNESRNFSINPGGQKQATKEEEKEKGKHQPQGIEKEEDVMYQRGVGVLACTSQTSLKDLQVMNIQLRDETRAFEGVMNTEVQNGGCSLLTPSLTHRRHSTSELGVPLLWPESQGSSLSSRLSSWSSQNMRGSNRDLRDALPNRGLSISELDLRVAIRKEEERMAGEVFKRNRSFSLSSNIKEFFGKTNSTEIVSSKNVRASKKRSSSPLLRLKTFSKSLDSSRSLGSKLKHAGSGNSLSGRESRASLPSICITPPASDTEHSPRLSRKLGTIPANVQALSGNELIANNVNKPEQAIKTRGQENNQFGTEERKPNAFDEKECLTKQQKEEENKQQKQQARSDNLCYYNEEGVHHGQNERERDRQTEKHGIERVETKKEGLDKIMFDEEEQDNCHSMICGGKDIDNYFAFCTYQASGDGEMTVYEGDEVEVLTKAPNGWWMVCIDDDVGWVPSNFLVAKGGQEDDANQESLELEDGQANARLSSDDYDGDDDEREHEDADEHGDDDDDVEEEYFDIVSVIANPKDEAVSATRSKSHSRTPLTHCKGQSVIWAQPDERPRQQQDRVHKKRYHYRGSPRLSRNKCWFDSAVKGQDVIRRSSRTWSNSSPETNSPNSDKPPKYAKSRRKKGAKRAYINDKQAYSTKREHNMVYRNKAPSSSKEAVCRHQKWYKRFEAMNGARCLSKEHRPLFTESRRMPQAKHKNLVSYDSGFPEDERTNAVRRIRKFLSVPDTRVSHHKRPSLATSYRRYNSQFDDGYVLSNLPQYRSDRAPLNVFHEDNSSDGEVFQKTKHPNVYDDSSCQDLEVHSYTRRPRKKTNRSQLLKYSVQKDAPYSPHLSGGHSKKLAYQAIASYRASTDDTIDLYEGDKVQVVRKSRGGWWFVKIDDEEGWAPSNYLEPITCYEP